MFNLNEKKMRILKSNGLLNLANSYLIDSPQPSNISYLWNFGSLLAVCLIIQIVTGVTLAMHYNPSVLEAFNSVEHIMRDVNNGWLIRYLHSNTASAFFFLVYLHIGRGMYYGSYRAPRLLTWAIGVVIFILMMATAFLGLLHSPKWFKIYKKRATKEDEGSVTQARAKSVETNQPFFRQIEAKNMSSFIFNKARASYGIYNVSTASRGRLAFKEARTFSTCSNLLTEVNSGDKSFILEECSCQVREFIKSKNLNPVFIYENLSEVGIKNRVLNETRNLSGIYLILNKFTNDYYIGSASTGKFHARFVNHLFNFNGSKVVKNAVKKYGIYSFAFLILELFPEEVNKENHQ